MVGQVIVNLQICSALGAIWLRIPFDEIGIIAFGGSSLLEVIEYPFVFTILIFISGAQNTLGSELCSCWLDVRLMILCYAKVPTYYF